ncbi:hypothetical protein [Hymenobacter sp. 102]|uniref:hypothetical protein n=1 Tax=Hymenobacter sp. 102 TaxID=3403152 RepID=UPI003CF82AB6
MQQLMYVLRLGLLTGLCLVGECAVPGRAQACTPLRPEVPESATGGTMPPASRRRHGRLRRAANPAAGTGRDYFRPRRLPSQRRPDSFGSRARSWWASHRPL